MKFKGDLVDASDSVGELCAGCFNEGIKDSMVSRDYFLQIYGAKLE